MGINRSGSGAGHALTTMTLSGTLKNDIYLLRAGMKTEARDMQPRGGRAETHTSTNSAC